MKQPREGNFILAKVKRMPGGGLDVKWKVVEDNGAQTFIPTFHIESPHEPKVDLHKKINELKEALCKVFNYETDEQKQCVSVTGVAISGKENNIGIIITGEFRTHTDKKCAINTERIVLKNNYYGFEADIENILADLTKEVYKFLYEENYDVPDNLFTEPKVKPRKGGRKKAAAEEVEETEGQEIEAEKEESEKVE